MLLCCCVVVFVMLLSVSVSFLKNVVFCGGCLLFGGFVVPLCRCVVVLSVSCFVRVCC